MKIPRDLGSGRKFAVRKAYPNQAGLNPCEDPWKSHAEVEPRFRASEQLWDKGETADRLPEAASAKSHSNRVSPGRAFPGVAILRPCHQLSCPSLGTAVREKINGQNGSTDFEVERLEAERGDDRRS